MGFSSPDMQRAYVQAHREKINAQRRAKRAANREAVNAKNRAWLKEARARGWRPKRGQASQERALQRAAAWRVANPERDVANQRAYYVRILRPLNAEARAAAILHYGGHCQCCGENWEPALTIDHINGGGRPHRQRVGGRIYWWLQQQGWPKEFRVLCWLCNRMAWQFGGECPCPRGQLHRLRIRGLAV